LITLKINNGMLALFLIMLCTVIIFESLGMVDAFEDAPAITINTDGSVQPSTASINQCNNTYTLTGDITNYYLDIRCSNITIDGSGYTVCISGMTYQSNHGILIGANHVVIKNFNVLSFGGPAIMVNGSYNTVENNAVSRCEVAFSLQAGASYNLIKSNNLINNQYGNIYLSGNANYNTITENLLDGMYVDGSNNVISDNTLNFFVKNGENNTYLNNIIGTEGVTMPTLTPQSPNTTIDESITAQPGNILISITVLAVVMVIVCTVIAALLIRKRYR
jgi:parallel beta-helix repeat protein